MVLDNGLTVEGAMNGILLHTDTATKLPDLAKLFFENRADAVIIRERGLPKGIVTPTDIIRGLVKTEKDLKDVQASDIMSSPIVSIERHEGLSLARSIMLDTGKRKLAVKKDYDIVGLIVETDILRRMG
ncbi:MAG: CBS domain-containing protein [archaeon]